MPLIAHDLAGLKISDVSPHAGGSQAASGPALDAGTEGAEEDGEEEDDDELVSEEQYDVMAEQIVRELEQGFGNPLASLHQHAEEEDEEEEEDERPPNWVAPPDDASSPGDDLIPSTSPYASDPRIRDAAVSMLHLWTARGMADFVKTVDVGHVELFEAMLEDLWDWPPSGRDESEQEKERREEGNEEMWAYVTRQKADGVKQAGEATRGRICRVARLAIQVVISELIVQLGQEGKLNRPGAQGDADPGDLETVRSALEREVEEKQAGEWGEWAKWVDVKGRVEWSRAELATLKRPARP